MKNWIGTFLFLLLFTAIALPFISGIPWLAWAGTLPGDIVIQKGSTTIYVPCTTSLILSIVFTLIFRE